MKANSIDEIREHLARGGRVVSGDNEIMEVTQKWIIGFAVSYHISDKPLDYYDFELLPLEEKEPVDHGTQPTDDAKGSPVGWTIVAIGEVDGSVLCQAPNGKRRRYWLMDHGTQKGQDPGVIREGVHWIRYEDVEMQKQTHERIRTRLLHGQWPEMTDLLAWWEATTGERIETGKRCERCDGSGKSPDFRVQCGVCQGSGYSVRPTWMEEGK